MNKNERQKAETLTSSSYMQTRYRSSGQGRHEKEIEQNDFSDGGAKEPSRKRRRQNGENDDADKRPSRPRTRSFSLDVEVASFKRNTSTKKREDRVSTGDRGSRKSRRNENSKVDETTTAVRRSHRESRKVFESLNEHTLVRNLVGDYMAPLSVQTGRKSSSRRQLMGEGETDSQGEGTSYVSMYDMIKSKTKSSKGDEEGDDEEDDDDDEKGSHDESGSDENEDDDDDAPQHQYKLREKKPITKRYMAPPLKHVHSSRRGLFSASRLHIRERGCSDKQPFSPVRKSYQLKRKTINESSTSTDEDDDDRKFERRKAKSMAKARNRCLPMNLGVEDMRKGILGDRERIGSSLADVDPMNIDRSITFESIGGLGKHVRSLKEMVVFPLLYPEVFEKFKVNPPRGVLFHGPPGLVIRNTVTAPW